MENNFTTNISKIFFHNHLNLSQNTSFKVDENYVSLNHVSDMGNDSFMILLRGILPLYLRVGFILIQIGCTPTSNANHILLQNIIDFSIATITYCLIGSTLAFGNDIYGIIGYFNWKCINNINMNLFMYGWTSVMITTGIITTMFSGRMHTIAYTSISFVTAAFIQPMFMHWLWDTNGILRDNVFQNKSVFFIDHSGTSNIHVCGGIIAFFGNLCFGRKVVRLKDLDREYFASMPLAVVGYFLIISGLMVNIPPLQISQVENMNNSIYYAKNNLMALCGGIIGTTILMKLTKNINNNDEWVIARYLQGGIMGIVILSGGLYMYTPISSLAIGILSSIVLYGQSMILLRSNLDDYCQIVPIHLIGGFVSLILPTFFICKHILTLQVFFIRLGWQLIGFFSIVITSILVILPLFFLFLSFNILRNNFEEKNHKLALDPAKQITPEDIFKMAL